MSETQAQQWKFLYSDEVKPGACVVIFAERICVTHGALDEKTEQEMAPRLEAKLLEQREYSEWLRRNPPPPYSEVVD